LNRQGDRFHPSRIKRITIYVSRGGDRTKGKPVVVLINSGSASASEIVAGALQDHRRAILLGTKSFGKGSVQTIIPVAGAGAMRLTTARYYTPSGRSIQAKGIEPDIEVQPAKVEEISSQGIREADLRGALDNDGAKTRKKRVCQIQASCRRRRGRDGKHEKGQVGKKKAI
jgi:carboxyl-terminal processing protease